MITIYTGYPEELSLLRRRIYDNLKTKIIWFNTSIHCTDETTLFHSLEKIKSRKRYLIRAEGGFPPYIKIFAESLARMAHVIKATAIGYNELFISVCVEKTTAVNVFVYHKGKAYKVRSEDVLDLYPDFTFNIGRYISDS